MISYVSEDSTCRSRYLLEYFGQDESEDCGNCDICRAAASRPARTRKALSSYILDDMNGDYTLNDISVRFGSPASDAGEDYLEQLRDLIDRGEVPPYRI